MSKSSHNVQAKIERECTHLCRSKIHAAQCVAATTKRAVTDRQLASYMYHLCANFAKKQDEVGRSVLHIAATTGKHELAQWLVTCASANVNIREYESGYTALHRAIYYGHINTAVRLIQFGASLDVSDNEDMTVLDMLVKEQVLAGARHADDSWRTGGDHLNLTMPCQPYVWGVNKNFSLGTGSDNTRKTPELLEFTKSSVSIVQVALEELHSVYVSYCGKVWTCGMGQGGRLGTGSNKSMLTPQPVKIPSKCIAAAVGINHTLLLLENHTVLSFGQNMEHQLGVHPWVECCLSPRQVCQSNFTSSNPVTGIAASKYHSVFYNDSAVWTCGLNGGQLGRAASSSTPYITQPMKVPLNLNNRKITCLASSIGAIVLALNNGDVYLLHKFQCKKLVSKQHDIVKIGVYGGSLECESVSETPSEICIVMLNACGSIQLWKEGQQVSARCIFSTKQCISVRDFSLTHLHLTIVTKDGSAYQGSFTNTPQPLALSSGNRSTVKSTQFHQFVEKSECYSVKLKRLSNVFRAVSVTCDSRGNNYAVIQTHPKTLLTDLPVISESEMSQQMATLLSEASDEDAVHDAVFKVSGRLYPVHCFVLNCNSKLLAEEACREKLVVIRDTNPYIFEQVLLFLYTGSCQLLHPGPFDTKKIGKKEDPLKLALEFCNKYKILALSKRLHKFRYEAGSIWLKEGQEMTGSQGIKLDRESGSEMYDVSIKAEDGSVVQAHRCILVARLDYFHRMFLGGWAETGRNCVLPLPFTFRVLKDLIDFIYTDQVPEYLSPEEDLDHIIRLLIAADQLLISRLKECCEVLLINAVTLRNAPTVLHLASIYNTPQLKASTIQFISINLASFLQSRLLEVLDDDVLKQLSDYYKEYTDKKYRVLTPFMDAPLDEEIITTPLIPWPDEFSLGDKTEVPAELKSPPSASKKKKTPKKIFSPIDGLDSSELDIGSPLQLPLVPVIEDSLKEKSEQVVSSIKKLVLTPPKNTVLDSDEVKNTWNSWQFPSLDSTDKQHRSASRPVHPVVIHSRLESSRKAFGPAVKLSQKERKRLSSESEKLGGDSLAPLATSPPKPVKTWATLPPLPSATERGSSTSIEPGDDSNFVNIIAHDKEKRANLAKMRSKPFHLTQLEEKALDELRVFYNAANEFDERITVDRVLSHIDKPQWIASSSKQHQ